MIDLRGMRIDVHARKQAKCAFEVATGIDLTGAVLHASVVDADGALWFSLDVEILSPATAGLVRVTAPLPATLYDTDGPGGVMNESTSLSWGLARHVVEGSSYWHEPIAYGKFAISGPVGIRADEV